MRVLTYSQDWYPDDINSKLNFDEFTNNNSDDALLVGLAPTYDTNIIKLLPFYNRSVYFNIEHPCTLFSGKNSIGLNPIEQQTLFTEVYTICPYTATWFNETLKTKTKFVSMPYVHNLKYNVYANNRKKFDIAYTGLVHDEEIAGYIRAIKDYNYVFTSIPGYNRIHTADSLITHNSIPNVRKWELMSATKLAVIQNNLYLFPKHIDNVRALPNWEANEAFSHLDTRVIPQLKSRTVESALCRNLMLVKRDHWNVIEKWFKPNEDFIYFDDAGDLRQKTKELLENYDSKEIQSIIDSAYNKVVKYYNTRYLFDRIKNGQEVL
jgi:hypothetical protein